MKIRITLSLLCVLPILLIGQSKRPYLVEFNACAVGFVTGSQGELKDSFPFGYLNVRDVDKLSLSALFGFRSIQKGSHTIDFKLGYKRNSNGFVYSVTDSWQLNPNANWREYKTTLNSNFLIIRLTDNIHIAKHFFIKADIDYNINVYSNLSEYVNAKKYLEITDGKKILFTHKNYFALGAGLIKEFNRFNVGLHYNFGLMPIIADRNLVQRKWTMFGLTAGYLFK